MTWAEFGGYLVRAMALLGLLWSYRFCYVRGRRAATQRPGHHVAQALVAQLEDPTTPVKFMASMDHSVQVGDVWLTGVHRNGRPRVFLPEYGVKGLGIPTNDRRRLYAAVQVARGYQVLRDAGLMLSAEELQRALRAESS